MAPPKKEKISKDEAKRLFEFYQKVELDITQKLNKALLKGNSTAYLDGMLSGVQKTLKELRLANKAWCEQAIPHVYTEGLYSADIMVEGLGIAAKSGFGGMHQQAAQVLAENTYNRLEDVTKVIGRQAEDIYRSLALEQIRGSTIGYDTWNEVARNYRERLAENGVTGFTDRSGRKWNMSSYAQMVARTSTMEAHLQGTTNRLLEQGFDLIKVSHHATACELCVPWEGKILSLTGKTPDFPTLEEARAAGLFHPNCRHAYGLYIDLDKELESSEKITELEEELNAVNIELAKYKVDLGKTYSDIWKNPVKVSDYPDKKDSIASKLNYFKEQVTQASSSDESKKFNDLIKLLKEYEKQGKKYVENKAAIDKLIKERNELSVELRKLTSGIDLSRYDQQHKDAAFWFKGRYGADEVLRKRTGELWKTLSAEEREALYDYTEGSGRFNRPLRGYEGSWQNYKGIGQVDLDYEGGKAMIEAATKALDRCSYDFDIWLQRGVETSKGAAEFLGIKTSELALSEKELQDLLVDKVVKDEAFLSTSACKGSGFEGKLIVNLYAPQGTKMIYAEPFSYYGRGAKLAWDGEAKQSNFGNEFEVILQRGSSYKITKVEKVGGQIYIDVDVFPPEL